MKVVFVHWQDAVSEDAWEDIEEAKKSKPHTIFTVGFLVDEDDDRILLALNWDPLGEAVSQTISIPIAWIMDQKEVEIP